MRLPVLLIPAALALAPGSHAEPPFTTDDPVPVDRGTWEIDIATLLSHDARGWNGALPLIEINYGALPNLELHLEVTNSFLAPVHESTLSGFGDMELGAKYRFLQETQWLPQVSIFPLVTLPTGDKERGLGSGDADVFLPLWMQKSFGEWTVYGGGGYWYNPGVENRNWWFSGLVVQRKIGDRLSLGAEIFHETPKEHGGMSDTIIRAGGSFEFSERYELLFSAGHSVQGRSQLEGYLGLQITFGPERERK